MPFMTVSNTCSSSSGGGGGIYSGTAGFFSPSAAYQQHVIQTIKNHRLHVIAQINVYVQHYLYHYLFKNISCFLPPGTAVI